MNNLRLLAPSSATSRDAAYREYQREVSSGAQTGFKKLKSSSIRTAFVASSTSPYAKTPAIMTKNRLKELRTTNTPAITTVASNIRRTDCGTGIVANLRRADQLKYNVTASPAAQPNAAPGTPNSTTPPTISTA